jgi:hypothetical protein
MLIKLIYLVKDELTLTKLKPCSVSRKIGLPDRARIIEFGFKGKGVMATISCGRFVNPKSACCHSHGSGEIQFY